jgi:hypothetical protein
MKKLILLLSGLVLLTNAVAAPAPASDPQTVKLIPLEMKIKTDNTPASDKSVHVSIISVDKGFKLSHKDISDYITEYSIVADSPSATGSLNLSLVLATTVDPGRSCTGSVYYQIPLVIQNNQLRLPNKTSYTVDRVSFSGCGSTPFSHYFNLTVENNPPKSNTYVITAIIPVPPK